MDRDVTTRIDGPLALVTLDRPRVKNAQSWKLLDELDEALDTAMADDAVRVAIVRGAGGNFSSGHDLGTAEQRADAKERGIPDGGRRFYENFRHYNLDLTLKWRNLPKPTIALVEGFCIYGGWMIAAAMDLVFAASDARFLPGFVEYFSVPWDLPPRKAKELLFESRFLTADEAHALGFVNRVVAPERLEEETLDYAKRVAENGQLVVRLSKLAVNKAQDAQGFSANMEAAFADYLVMMAHTRLADRDKSERRLAGVDLALRRKRGSE